MSLQQEDTFKDPEHDGRLRESGQMSQQLWRRGEGSGGLPRALQVRSHESQTERVSLTWVCPVQPPDVLLIIPAATGRSTDAGR